MMRKLAIVAFIAVIIATAAIVFTRGKNLKTETPPAPATAALTVTTTAARRAQWPEIIHATGAISPWQEAIIGAEITGQRLTDVLADVGDTVSKGQVLARFETDTLLTQQAELQAVLTQAIAVRDRSLLLKKSGAIAVEKADSDVQQAAIAQARFDANEVQLKHAVVTAPDDGIISSRSATLGAVGANGQELFRLIRQNRLEWRGQATAQQLARLKIGQDITLALPNGTTAKAKLRQIAPILDTNTRMATLYADIEAGGSARAGMYGEGSITLETRQVLVLPAKSVVIRDGRSYVFRLEKKENDIATAHIAAVTAGRSEGIQTEITGGIAAGDIVAVDGAGFLNDGDIVRIASKDVTQ